MPGTIAAHSPGSLSEHPKPAKRNQHVNIWKCIVCDVVYDEALGMPDDGIAPGTRWEDVPEDWYCPECGVSKADFELITAAP
jgi:rubredoxin